jgi:hypothetical protein
VLDAEILVDEPQPGADGAQGHDLAIGEAALATFRGIEGSGS